jgi:hypothetical protein
MSDVTRAEFTVRRKKWCLARDRHKCQAPFEHKCDTLHPLQVHHILPHAYLHRVATNVEADFPGNFICLCQTAHDMIHPDSAWARKNYFMDNDSFRKLRDKRSQLMDEKRIYWNDTYDRSMQVIALINTKRYRKPFPVYTKRRKHEDFEDTKR